jgi:hypothetical protein
MKGLLLISIFIFCLSSGSLSHAQLVKTPKLVEKLLPAEFELVYKNISNNLEPQRKEEFIRLSHRLNDNFKKIPFINLVFMLKSEIYRSIIQYQFDMYIQKIDINLSFLKNLEQKVISNKGSYTRISLWILLAIAADLDPYLDTDVFANLHKVDKKKPKDMKMAAEIKKKLKYLKKWFYIADKFSPLKFNSVVIKMSWDILYSINSYVEVLGHFTSYAQENLNKEVEFFELPALPNNVAKETLSNFVLQADYQELNLIEIAAEKAQAEALALLKSLNGQPPEPIQEVPQGPALDPYGMPLVDMPPMDNIPPEYYQMMMREQQLQQQQQFNPYGQQDRMNPDVDPNDPYGEYLVQPGQQEQQQYAPQAHDFDYSNQAQQQQVPFEGEQVYAPAAEGYNPNGEWRPSEYPNGMIPQDIPPQQQQQPAQ